MSRNISDLHPTLQKKIAELKTLCESKGLNIGIGECLRTVAEQNALYAKGRTASGSIVTNAKGTSYSSQHQWGIAVDFFKNVKGHEYDDIAFFEQVAALAKSIGLGWGGDWTSIKDRAHLYLSDWGSTATKLKQQYGTPEKFFASWKVEKSTTEQNTATVPVYVVGKNYTLQAEMKVRIGAGTNYRAKKYSELTADGKRYDTDKDGALNKGTVVTCKEVVKLSNDIWMRTPSGWIAAVYNGKVYIK